MLSTPLGKSTEYPSQYAPELLFPLKRSEARRQLCLGHSLPFEGNDYWTAYEVSWLDTSGKPQVRLANFVFTCRSAFLVESKSFKLYLNSYNQTVFNQEHNVITQMRDDLSRVTGEDVQVSFCLLSDDSASTQALAQTLLPGRLIDHADIVVKHYQPQPALLQVDSQSTVVNEIVYSHLLKTNCPVTGQPDWATLFIEYTGNKIVDASLLAYIISFREHQDFHENCVETLFCDINQCCSPECLTVYARYTRRGGLDINPLRSNYGMSGSEKSRLLASLPLRVSRQ